MYKTFFKRAFDLVGAFGLIAILSPVLLILIISLSFYYKGSPFFKQKRPGKNGVIFKVVKFKSMKDAYDSQGNPLPNKDRITNVGRFLRKTSLDELPQLFNVIKGEMSFIGPRPLFVEYLDYYNLRERKRHDVRPGMTGLAQVNGRNTLDWDSRLELDVRYVENLNFKTDLQIAMKTIQKILATSDISVVPSMPMLHKIRVKYNVNEHKKD